MDRSKGGGCMKPSKNRRLVQWPPAARGNAPSHHQPSRIPSPALSDWSPDTRGRVPTCDWVRLLPKCLGRAEARSRRTSRGQRTDDAGRSRGGQICPTPHRRQGSILSSGGPLPGCFGGRRQRRGGASTEMSRAGAPAQLPAPRRGRFATLLRSPYRLACIILGVGLRAPATSFESPDAVQASRP